MKGLKIKMLKKNIFTISLTKYFRLIIYGFIVFILFNWNILSSWYFYYLHTKYFLNYNKILESVTILFLSFIFYIFFLYIFIIAIKLLIKAFKVFIS
jgi:hypothetical protein